jgi:hypothetical protein
MRLPTGLNMRTVFSAGVMTTASPLKTREAVLGWRTGMRW